MTNTPDVLCCSWPGCPFAVLPELSPDVFEHWAMRNGSPYCEIHANATPHEVERAEHIHAARLANEPYLEAVNVE